MLFHDRRSGTLVNIVHEDTPLTIDKAMSKYKAAVGEHGERDMPANEQHGFQLSSDPSSNLPGVNNMQHQMLQDIHGTMKKRAEDEGIKNELRAKKAGM